MGKTTQTHKHKKPDPQPEKRCGLKLFRHLVWGILSLSLLAVAVLAVTLQLFVFWLNTAKGADWLAQKLADAAQNTGYRIVLQDFRLHGLTGVRAVYVTVADQDGVFVTARNADISLNVLPLALRRISVTAAAEALDILRLPAAQTQNTEAAKTGAVLPARPDIYFDRLSVDLRLPHLSLPPAAGGLTLGLESVQTISLAEKPQWQGAILLKNPQGAAAQYLPEQAAYHMTGDWESGTLHLSKARLLKRGLYVFDLTGGYNPADQVFEVAVKGALRQRLRREIGEEIRLDLTAAGTAADAAGRLKLDGQLAGESISATLPFALRGDVLELPALTAALPGITAEGALVLDRSTGLAEGKISAVIAHFGLAETLSGMDGLRGGGRMDVIFSHPQQRQEIAGQIRLQDAGYGTTTLKTAQIDITPREDGQHHAVFAVDGYDHAPFKAEGVLLADLQRRQAVLDKTVLALGKGRAVLSGMIAAEELSMQAVLENISPDDLPFAALGDYPAKITTGKITISGTAAQPVITATAKISGQMRDIADAGLTVAGGYQNGAAQIALTGTGRGIQKLAASASFPLTLSLYPFALDMPASMPLEGAAAGDFDLQQVVAPFLAAGQELTGAVKLEAALSGTLAQPVYDGSLVLDGAAFRDAATGILLKDIKGRMRFDRTGLVLENLTASDGGSGRVSMTGTLATGGGRDMPDITARLVLKGMHLVRASHAGSILSGDVSVLPQRGRYAYLVQGGVQLDTVLITLPERFEKSVPSLNIVTAENGGKAGMLDRVGLDLTLKADNRVFVRGWGLDAELKGALAVTGTLAEPDVRGTLGLVRGRYEELGKNFNILRADLRFQGAIPPSPYLDILTETKAGDIRPRIGITGTAEDPQITITSDPPRPQEEVISQLLFGRDAGAISPFQAVQLAAAIRRLTTGEQSGFDPVGNIRSAAGLDDLRIGGDAEGGVTVGAGKYITDKVYIEAETGSGEAAGAAKIQIELTPSVTVESKTGTTGTTGVGIFWKRDY